MVPVPVTVHENYCSFTLVRPVSSFAKVVDGVRKLCRVLNVACMANDPQRQASENLIHVFVGVPRSELEEASTGNQASEKTAMFLQKGYRCYRHHSGHWEHHSCCQQQLAPMLACVITQEKWCKAASLQLRPDTVGNACADKAEQRVVFNLPAGVVRLQVDVASG